MPIFYTPDISENFYALSEDESKHCIRVLRLKKGAIINLVDGFGGFFKAEIVDDNPKSCQLDIIEKISNFEKPNYKLHLAVAPTKNTDRMEWLIEKAVEIGIDEFTPIICEHSERKSINAERFERIVISAMKQSIKAYKPIINESMSFKTFIDKAYAENKFIAHCINNEYYEKSTLRSLYNKGQSALCLIGPEGDFTETEVSTAIKAGFKGITLGNNRFRTETAALVACHSIYFLNQ